MGFGKKKFQDMVLGPHVFYMNKPRNLVAPGLVEDGRFMASRKTTIYSRWESSRRTSMASARRFSSSR